ncbi:tRNA lysidine(34) synthetase TilS [Polymorphum gilvum]|uniref:tRNA(Ile)-lysidine synthase n=1 Tax=Polymorphum gilvum (strain LMG 25793 / CGMCC 1.9160 / SL003B-26A1) TaxID=991905 RepID=F2IX65_POLGS|nr:tRNA lysidine(34) synthetase TilS [Polymorphum gilvum]ADZ69356.1 Predicted ATPase of the PP-loop superfamily implicated in cell cycle control [Polymorphum gilvum SL003B-26A1]
MPDAPETDAVRPFSSDDADALFMPLLDLDRLAIAVSGGADSLALLHLFADWQRRTARAPQAHVFTVDHGLRAEARAEAEHVHRLCAGYCLPHEILTWAGRKGAPNLQATAREARYTLIGARMRALSLSALAVAHHRDDQAETFLDRLTRGSGVYGLAAMAADEADGPVGVRILRPLLDVPKARLIATLEAAGLSWFEDPSNTDLRYKRARLRRLGLLLAEEGLDQARLAATAARLRRAADALDGWAERLVRDHCRVHPAGPAEIAVAPLAEAPEEVRLRSLSRLIRATGGAEHGPRLEALEPATAALLAGEAASRTLGGVVLRRSGPVLRLWRERGRTWPAPLDLAPGEDGIWDGRYLVRAPVDGGSLAVRALAEAGVEIDRLTWPTGWPRDAFACAPAIVDADGRLLFVPGLMAPRAHQGQARVSRFRPFPPEVGGAVRTG